VRRSAAVQAGGMSSRRLLAGLVFALVLGLAAVAVAKVSVTRQGGVVSITGTSGADEVTIRNIAGVGNPMQRFYAISDPGGVTSLPPGCFRFSAKEIHCPVELVDEFEIDMGGGDDEVIVQQSVAEEFDIDGGAGDDILSGGPSDDIIRGTPGDDIIRGGSGDDTELGGGGEDRVFGGGGDDRLLGGASADRLVGSSGRDLLNGGGGRDRCNGGPANDRQRSCEIGANY
jgi:Ca2+-binding RTX toxin-like protein